MTKKATTTPAATDTDAQGQPIGGQAAEPPVEALADVETPAVAVEQVDQATLEEQRQEKIKAKRFKDTGRDAISKRLSEQRATEQTEFRQNNPEQAELGDQIAGVPSADRISRMEAEVRGDPDPAEAQPQPAATPRATAKPKAAAAPQENVDPPLASTPKTYTIRVYGKEDVLTEEQLVAGYQKLKAAGVRLEDAATYEAQVGKWAKDVQAWADEQARKYATQDGARGQPAGGPANPQPPSGAVGQVDKAKLREAQAALLRGDDEAATEIMAEVIANATARQPSQASTPSEQVAVPRMPARTQRAAWSKDDMGKINEAFNRDFGDLDDDAFAAAQGMMNARLANPAFLGKSPEELVQEVGATVRRMQVTPAPTPTPTPQPSAVATELENRRTLKAQIPITAPAGSARAPAAPPAPRFPSNVEYVQSLRRRSGSNSTR